MHKSLIFRNVKKSFREYFIYFLTLTLGVAMFYTFHALTDIESTMQLVDWQSMAMWTLGQSLTIFSAFVLVVMALLMIYANAYLMRTRAKELGVYLLLGMENSGVAKILFVESIAIGLAAYVAGILLGIVASQGAVILVLRYFDEKFPFHFLISTSAMLKTALYFAALDLIVLVANIIRSYSITLIGLFKLREKNEKMIATGKVFDAILFVIGAVSLGYAYHLIRVSGFLPSERSFWNSLLFGTVGTFLVFRGFASFFIILTKNTAIYKKGLTSYLYRSLARNVRSTYSAMAAVSILLLIAMGAMISAGSISVSVENLKRTEPLFDARVAFRLRDGNADVRNAKMKERYGEWFEDSLKTSLEVYFYDGKVDVKDAMPWIGGYEKGDTKWQVSPDERTVRTMRYSDYRALAESAGHTPKELSDGEALLVTTDTRDRDAVAKGDKTVTLFGKTLAVAPETDWLQYTYIIEAPQLHNLFLVVPDEVLADEKPDAVSWYMQYAEGKEEKAETRLFGLHGGDEGSRAPVIEKIWDDVTEGSPNVGFSFFHESRRQTFQNTMTTGFIATMTSAFVGVLFTFFTAAVLSVHELGREDDERRAMRTLSSLGASRSMMKRTLMRRIAIIFFLPFLVALMHTYFGIRAFRDILALMTYGETSVLRASVVMTAILLVIYIGYFIATYTVVMRQIEMKE